MSKFITSKDLAAELEMNERTFRQPAKIKSLGLNEALDRSTPRIRFHRVAARRILTARGIAVSF